MKLKIAVVASGPLIAEEITHTLQSIISEDIDIKTYLTYEIDADVYADIYVCAQTQLKPLSQIVPPHKIVLLDLMPNSKFFITIARIPKRETVYVFNNYLEYAHILSDYCKNLGITDIDFVPIAYREMPQAEIATHLQKAKYIIGVDRFLSQDGLLSPNYRPYLREDVVIIPATRTASVHSACVLIQNIAVKFHEHFAQTIEKIKAELQGEDSTPGKLLQIRKEVNALVISSNTAINIIQNALTKSVLNNIASDINFFETDTPHLDIEQLSNQSLCTSLDTIAASNRTLQIIADKLAKL